jgi:hypothetical protein
MPNIVGARISLNYGFNAVRFISPVRVDSRIRGLFTLKNLSERKPGVNGHRRFRKSGHLKFPSLAGGFVSVISRDGDRAFPLLAGGRAVSARAVG